MGSTGEMAGQDASSSSAVPEVPELRASMGSEEAVEEAVQLQHPVTLARALLAWKEKR